MEHMAAFAPNERAAVARHGASWTTCIVGDLANTAHVFILDIPRPERRHRPGIHLDFHRGLFYARW